MKKFVLTIVSCLVLVIAGAQSGKLKKANNFYGRFAYSEAVTLYTELTGSSLDNPKMQANLADCYYQIGETDKAEEIYAKVVFTEDVKSEDIYNYAQSLKENGKYADSDKWM